MSTLRLAWRNLWRNPRRTLLALSAIGLSVALVLAYQSILRSYGNWMVATITGPMLGDVQIHAQGWRKDRAMDKTLQVEQLSGALRSNPGVADVAPRIYAPALAARSEEGFAVVVIGLEPDAETRPMRLLEGLSPRLGDRRLLVGKALASQIGVQIGEEIAVVGQGVDGSLANDLFTVSGLIETSVDLVNRQGIVMSLADAQTLLAMPGEAHELVVHARAATTAQALAATISGQPMFESLEVLDWQSIAPEMLTLVEIVQIAWVFILGLVLIAAAAGVANTMLMATFERTREFGMLLALGTGPRHLVRLIVVESVVLGVLGALAGSALALTLVALTHERGIDYAALTGGGPSAISFAGMRWSLRLYPTLEAVDIVRTVSAVILTSIVASLWPAARAARLQPANALRA
jgi:ABC-type lipoprotein release transport system permease subunit